MANHYELNRLCKTCVHFEIVEKFKGFKKYMCNIAPVPMREIGREDYLVGEYVHCTCLGRKYEPKNKDEHHEEKTNES